MPTESDPIMRSPLSRPTRGRAAVLGLAAALVASATVLPAAGAFASEGLVVFCPPATQKVGVAVDEYINDAEEGSGIGSVLAGSLPPGISLVQVPTLGAKYKGTPTTPGHYDFTLRMTTTGGTPDDKACSVNVVAGDWATDRIGGVDRYESSVLVSETAVAAPSSTVYIASGENFADALSVSAIAAARKAPLLLTSSASVSTRVSESVVRYRPTDIVVIGGENTIKQTVLDQIHAAVPAATITRIGGVDRYAVSRSLITNAKFGAPASTSLFVASGQVFPDALSASPAAALMPAPVLLVNGSATHLAPEDVALITARGVNRSFVFGGSDTLSSGIENDLRSTAGSVERIEGVNRYVGSAKVAARFFTTASPSNTVYLATGATYPDALAGGVLAGVKKSPILLVGKSCMTAEVAAEVRRLNPAKLVLLGGPNSLDATLTNLPVCA
ncbi:MAG: cell wall-binding repeat-containing protein [Herbiconiux sp.]|nr:cell wall-binding repeat-containing protein [Herbiconiux sp.]